MKFSGVIAGVAFLFLGLMICQSDVFGADWKEFTEATTGIFYYDPGSITSPAEGIVRVWIHNMNRNETQSIEFNCKGGGYRVLDVIEYDEANRIKNRYDYYDNPGWTSIAPKSVPEPLRKIVCP